MYEFKLPNYNGGSIVNLMSSISHSFKNSHFYPELSCLNSKELKNFKNVILIVIDGLGYNYLKEQKSSFLFNNLKEGITSTFLSTTACANTVFLTGYPPNQSGLTGWDINLKEVGSIVSILKFSPFYGGPSLTKSNFDIKDILNLKKFYRGFDGECFSLVDEDIINSPFNSYISEDIKNIPIKDIKDSFKKIRQIINNKSKKRKFLHTYISDFDYSAHKFGVNSKKTKETFFMLDKKIREFVKSINKTNTKIIIIADHGFIDPKKGSKFFVDDFKGLNDCLTIPLAGESRVRDCFVRPSKVKDFEEIIKNKMSKYCWCFKGEQLIKDEFYGKGKINPKIFDRVGDYVLIMKEDYVLKNNQRDKSKKSDLIGYHGGVSENEMIVPLVTIDCL